MKQYHHKNQTGFTLIETLFAVLIFSTALISLMAIAGRGISATNTAKQQIVAQYLAQEGLEVVRNIRDSNFISTAQWDTGLDICTSANPCNVVYAPAGAPLDLGNGSSQVLQDSDGFFTDTATVPSGFTREIVLTAQGLDEYLVASTVSWDVKGLVRTVVLETLLTNWQ
jgi:type II secretory pathway pseudopilin PulG